ncbi:MAG: tRNA lysidine(34) synthetase TilS, partial [Odoribacter sp.]|nr:tRNA lysidine(34) synthetase TilS [Odoribacter sp.]
MVRKAIERFLEQYHIGKDAGFLLAVSGGADSVSLLHAFHALHLKASVLHCNFSLRGAESDADEQFVKRLCEGLGIACHIRQFDTARHARENGLSIEMAARELRYAWFREMKQTLNMDYIVVAHHADDVAETVLINLCRGTGIKGLTGIQPINGDILRPLLECSRDEILTYLAEHRLDYRTDSSNHSLDYVRNKIRHQVIPVFKEINPAFLNTLAENCTALKETERIFRYGLQQLREEVLKQEGDEMLLDIPRILSAPAPYTLLYEILKPYGFNKKQIRDILNTHDAIPGKQFTAGNTRLVKDRHCWRLDNHSQCTPTHCILASTGQFDIAGHSLLVSVFPRPADFKIPQTPDVACLDADKGRFPLL